MKKDNYKTDVIFRVDTTKDFKGEVLAIFPHEVETFRGEVRIYVHVGQHSAADYGVCLRTSRLATKKESADLRKELRGLGYNINEIKKRNYDKYLKSYYEAKKIL